MAMTVVLREKQINGFGHTLGLLLLMAATAAIWGG
jgi:hypothetical protein